LRELSRVAAQPAGKTPAIPKLACGKSLRGIRLVAKRGLHGRNFMDEGFSRTRNYTCFYSCILAHDPASSNQNFFDKGGYVAQAKCYREYAKKAGLFKTLEQKKAENPNVDLLIGAANIWNFEGGKVALCQEMKAAGAVGEARPVQYPLRHAADVHVQQEAVGKRQGALRGKLQEYLPAGAQGRLR
jgi:hypothetical protein